MGRVLDSFRYFFFLAKTPTSPCTSLCKGMQLTWSQEFIGGKGGLGCQGLAALFRARNPSSMLPRRTPTAVTASRRPPHNASTRPRSPNSQAGLAWYQARFRSLRAGAPALFVIAPLATVPAWVLDGCWCFPSRSRPRSLHICMRSEYKKVGFSIFLKIFLHNHFPGRLTPEVSNCLQLHTSWFRPKHPPTPPPRSDCPRRSLPPSIGFATGST